MLCLLHFKRICSFFSLNVLVTEHGGRNKGQALKKDDSQQREEEEGEELCFVILERFQVVVYCLSKVIEVIGMVFQGVIDTEKCPTSWECHKKVRGPLFITKNLPSMFLFPYKFMVSFPTDECPIDILTMEVCTWLLHKNIKQLRVIKMLLLSIIRLNK